MASLQRLKRRLWRWRSLLVSIPLVTLLVLGLRLLGIFQPLEWQAYDSFMRLRPPAVQDSRIAIVGIDAQDLATLNSGFLPDAAVADALERLAAQDPVAIGLDVHRDLPFEPGHDRLDAVFRRIPNLVGIAKIVGTWEREIVGPSPVLEQLGRVGFNDVVVDGDNTVRRGLVYLTQPGGEAAYSFSFYLALHYLDQQNIGIEVIDQDVWQIGRARLEPFAAYDGGYVRADDRGYQVLINYRGPSRTFETVSLRDLLADRLPPDWARDRIVLLGYVGEGSKDYFFTPYSGGLLTLPEPMAGVEIHANLTSQLLSAAIDGRPLIHTLPERLEWLWVMVWAALGGSLSWLSRSVRGRQWSLAQRLLGPIAAGALLVALTYGEFIWGVWIPLVPAMLAYLGTIGAMTWYLAQSAGRIRHLFGRYVSDQVVETLLDSPDKPALGGETRLVTILVADIRGFTAFAETYAPVEVLRVVNHYLSCMSEVISHYEGTIGDFIGDGILVFFGAPTARSDDARRAVGCAIAMQQAIEPVNQQMEAWEFPPLEIGIGIHTDQVIVGNLGSEKRTKFTALGSGVNLAYRIESYTTGGQVFISQETLAAAGPDITVKAQQTVQPKGIGNALTIYSISAIGAPYHLTLADIQNELTPIDPVMPVSLAMVINKEVGERSYAAHLVQLSSHQAVIQMVGSSPEPPFKPLLNLRISFPTLQGGTEPTTTVYAKVVDTSEEGRTVNIRFTSTLPKALTRLGQPAVPHPRQHL